ncbi:MAG: thiamine pyrophosphate-dependent enzyme, partial [Saprospiraceae bacterium]|nr:thiamine pyrophosphate-dependent enzyme [Saprospiraceae bacterium]
DGSYLMLSQEIITSVQEGHKLTIILVNNHGFASIGGLSRSLGTEGFGTRYLYRNDNNGQIGGDEVAMKDAQSRYLPVDLAKNAESLGAVVFHAANKEELEKALAKSKKIERTTLVYVETDRHQGVEGYCWWDVPVAEISQSESVRNVFDEYIQQRQKQSYYLDPSINSEDWAD